MKQANVAILGATGAVGETLVQVLEELDFPVGKLYPLASSRSAGGSLMFKGQVVEILDADQFDWHQADIGLFSAGAAVSEIMAPKAAAAGCVVVDNTSQFRYDDDIPLVVPEVNPEHIAHYTQRGIIANPNCSTIQMMVALKPIYDVVGIERINVATYQAVSGSGKEAMDELKQQTQALSAGVDLANLVAEVYPKPIAANVIPHIDVFQDNGYTKEEMKMVWETQKILGDASVRVNPTAVRVPVVYGHSEAIHIETKQKMTADQARDLLSNSPGLVVIDERVDGGYPTALTEAAGQNPVFVGRIREDVSYDLGLNLWVVADNVRKGAATNTVQIARILWDEYLSDKK